MTKLSKQDAIALAKLFKEAALALGNFQLDNWESLSKSERRDLTDEEYSLLDHSQNLVTYAVGVMLDDAQTSLEEIKQATAKANQAIQSVKNVKKAIEVAAALVTVGAAIHAGNPGGIASAVANVARAIKS